MTRTKGSIIRVDNTEIRKMLMDMYDIYDKESYSTFVPDWVDDCIRGGITQLPSERKPSTYKVFQYLTFLDEINVNSVREILSVKMLAIEGKLCSVSYAQKWVKVLKWASEALQHHTIMHPEKLAALKDS